VMGTADGLSMAPYIRESRRTRGISRITAQDVLATVQPNARARHWPDSIGIGWYPLDLHPAPGNSTSRYEPTRPFQIPLGALIPPDCDNLICANKNIATTHLSNGSYRLHPVEWSIGTGAGMAVAVAYERSLTLRAVRDTPDALRVVQTHLLKSGTQLAWAVDVLPGDDIFVQTQWLLLQEIISNDAARGQSLAVYPDDYLTVEEYDRFVDFLRRHRHERTRIPNPLRWRDACTLIAL
jgi:hypothetical protein